MKVEFDTDWSSLIIGAGVAWGPAGTGIEIRLLFWALIVRWGLAFVLLLALASPLAAQRTYWPTTVDSLALGRRLHTHVAVRAVIDSGYPKRELDGDVHIRLVPLVRTGRFIIAECIPALPCLLLRAAHAGDTVTVYGITRLDPEHGWREVHPVEKSTK